MIKFTAHSSAPIQYLKSDAKHLLRIIGKDESSAQGIITEEQLPAALQALEQAIEREETALEEGIGAPQNVPVDERHDHVQEGGDKDDQAISSVSLRRRALPLLQLLRAAQEGKEYVIWESQA